MSSFHLVDFMLVALVLGYGPIGASRGGFREGVLGAGLVVTGALMISPPIGWLNGAVQDRIADGRQVVALVCLAVGLALGLGAGRIVERHASSARGRIVGVFCGLANALWICTYLLVELERMSKLSSLGTWLAGGVLFRPLVSHNEATLLALSTAGLFVSGLWTAHLIWVRLGTDAVPATGWTPRQGASTRRRATHVPNGADSGKLDPIGAGSTISLASTAAIRRDVAPNQSQDYRRVLPGPTTRRQPSVFWYSVGPPDDSGTTCEEDH